MLTKKTIKKLPVGKIASWFLTLSGLAVISVLIFMIIFNGKIYPNISVAGNKLSGMTRESAAKFLRENINVPQKIKLTYQDQSFELFAKDISLSHNFDSSVDRVYAFTRTGNILFDIYQSIRLLVYPKNFSLDVSFDDEALTKFVSVLSGQISVDPAEPFVIITDGRAVITNGTSGIVVNSALLSAEIGNAFSEARESEIQIPIDTIDAKLTEGEIDDFQKRVDSIVGKDVEIKFDSETDIYDTFKYLDKDIVKMLNPKGGFNDSAISEIINNVSLKSDRDPQNPKFNFNNGRVTEFLPAKSGIKVDVNGLKIKIEEGIANLSQGRDKNITIDVPVKKTLPEVETGSVNDLGINELIGRGTSRFRGSIPSRVYNVQLASSRLNGILIKPGETFSFNTALGDVSKFTGFREAYVISEGKTILGDGGGVCQVSTTLFRAVLNAGLPISERQAHAYRVGYYEQASPPGLDATVYGPSPDLKIKNDTPGHILIQTIADTKNYSLVFELYGTNDGRVATTSKPITTNVTLPGDDLYIDDPSLPTGTVKQTEHRANGARVTFNYLVQRGGEVIYKKTFVSNYRPWAGVYLRGTGPAN